MKCIKIWDDAIQCYNRTTRDSFCKWLFLVSNVLVFIWICAIGFGSASLYVDAQSAKASDQNDNLKVSLLDPGQLLLLIPNPKSSHKPDTYQPIFSSVVTELPDDIHGALQQMLGLGWLGFFLPFSLFYLGKVCFQSRQSEVHRFPKKWKSSWLGPMIGLLFLCFTLFIPVLLLILLIDANGVFEVVFNHSEFPLFIITFACAISLVTSIIFFYSRNIEKAFFKLNGSWILFALLIPFGGFFLNHTIPHSGNIVTPSEVNEIHGRAIEGYTSKDDRYFGEEALHVPLTLKHRSRTSVTELFSKDFFKANVPRIFLGPGMMKCLCTWLLGVLVVVMGSRRNQWAF